jgi:hypothetical protein
MSPPDNSIIWIHRRTPHFDRKAAWPFTDREVSYVKTAVKQALPRGVEIIEEWHGSDFISIRVNLGTGG